MAKCNLPVADCYKIQEIHDRHNVSWECTQEDYNTTASDVQSNVLVRNFRLEKSTDFHQPYGQPQRVKITEKARQYWTDGLL